MENLDPWISRDADGKVSPRDPFIPPITDGFDVVCTLHSMMLQTIM